MVTVEDTYLPMNISVPGMTDEKFQEFCDQYSDYRLEYTAEGELIIMPPTDSDTSGRNVEITYQLKHWARTKQGGFVTESSGGFSLPNGARLAPDAAWTSNERKRHQPTCPEFVIELLSPSDRRKRIHAKMLEWIENGAELGWMIDPERKSVTIYRPGREPEVRTGIEEVAGEGPVAGFVLDLRPVWSAG